MRTNAKKPISAAVTATIAAVQRFLVRRFGEETSSPILINLLTPFGAYLVAETIGASGILAAVAAGVTMSYVELNGRALATTRVQRAAVPVPPNVVVIILLRCCHNKKLPHKVVRKSYF